MIQSEWSYFQNKISNREKQTILEPGAIIQQATMLNSHPYLLHYDFIATGRSQLEPATKKNEDNP